jgi:hypothetical protein
MQKPLSVEVSEFKNRLADVINECKLPAVVLSAVLKEVCADVDKQARMQNMKEQEEWRMYLEEQKASEEASEILTASE